MPVPAPDRPARRSEARERLLSTASGLFYAEGIAAVGVDRIVTEGSVTLATLYRHFPSKEHLAVAYLDNVHELIAEQLSQATEGTAGPERVQAIGALVSAELGLPGFRGCAFINAASETEDPDSPIRQAVARHRRWYFETVRDAFVAAGHARPGNAARHFLMLRDGAMVGGGLDSPSAAQRTFSRGVRGLLRSVEVAALADAEDPDEE